MVDRIINSWPGLITVTTMLALFLIADLAQERWGLAVVAFVGLVFMALAIGDKVSEKH